LPAGFEIKNSLITHLQFSCQSRVFGPRLIVISLQSLVLSMQLLVVSLQARDRFARRRQLSLKRFSGGCCAGGWTIANAARTFAVVSFRALALPLPTGPFHTEACGKLIWPCFRTRSSHA
jgi:hypothetical protein